MNLCPEPAYETRDDARADAFEYIEAFYKYVSYCPTSLCH